MTLPARTRAVVTGAGSGLGRAFCRQLAARGARIVASDVQEDRLRETVDLLGGSEVHAVRCDVAVAAEVEALASEADRLLGGTDLVVNNAGVAVGGPVGQVPLEDWIWIMGVNLWGVIHGCHTFVPRFRRQGSGHVLNVASVAGLLAAPGMAPYNVTKSGVVALSETLHAELAPLGIGVSVLCPTFFLTNIARDGRGVDETHRAMAQTLMERSSLSADDVARVALDAADAKRLFVLPHADGRWLWRAKRVHPAVFQAFMPRLFAWQSAALAPKGP